MARVEDLVHRAEELIELGGQVLETNTDPKNSVWVDRKMFGEFRASALSFLMKVFGAEHPYYSEMATRVNEAHYSKTEYGIGVIRGARSEIEGGWLASTRSFVSAEIFTEFLEMAEHLLEEGYKDPAAVMGGGVLENHLRNLCISNDIETDVNKGERREPKASDRMNAELAAKGVYSKLDQKAVTAWAALRNHAAHGQYEKYASEQVKLMLNGITDFITRNPR